MAGLGHEPDPVDVIRSHGTRPMNLSEQLHELSPTRRALLAAGTVTLALSMALSIAPAFAAGNGNGGNGGGNSGTVKIHDVIAGADETGNDPAGLQLHRRLLWFRRSGPVAPGRSTASRPPPVIRSSTAAFTASASGDSETQPITLAAGHYKLDWSLNGENAKHKSFIVKDTCDAR